MYLYIYIVIYIYSAAGHTSTWSARARMLLTFGYGVALHLDPFLSLASLVVLVWKDKKYQKPKKKEKTKKEEKITTTTKNQIKHEEFKVHLCKSIQELKRGCGRPGLFLLLLLGLLLPTASASASAIAQDDVSLDSYFSVQPIVGHQSFLVGAPNPAAWGGAVPWYSASSGQFSLQLGNPFGNCTAL